MKRLVVFGATMLLIGLLFFVWRGGYSLPKPEPNEKGESVDMPRGGKLENKSAKEWQPVVGAGEPSVSISEEEDLDLDLTEDLSDRFWPTYGKAEGSLSRDLDECVEVLFAFTRVLQGRSDLPPLGNRELVAALLGENHDRVRFLSPRFSGLNDRGELVDRFGSPLFFHFQDGFLPDVRSAGPDGVMWTADDVERGVEVRTAF